MTTSQPRHFLTLLDLSPAELNWVINRAIELKAIRNQGDIYEPFRNRVLGMIFGKSSTRTRVSFEAGMAQLGGHAIFLSPRDTQLGRGEPIEDSAKVISSMVDIVMIRTDGHDIVENFAANSRVPVINALTDDYHPCQLLADVQTYVEHRGSIQGKTVTWVGDGNNMCHSFINAARQFDFQLRIACPEGFDPDADLVAANADRVSISRDPNAAVAGAHLVVTDTWASMGQEDEKTQRLDALSDFQVNQQLMALASKEAIFMHCLPAARGEEVTNEVMDGKQSAVWLQTLNRIHLQKSIIQWCLK